MIVLGSTAIGAAIYTGDACVPAWFSAQGVMHPLMSGAVYPQAALLAALPNAFDDKSAWPDLVVEACGQEISVHRVLLGLLCKPLAAMLNGATGPVGLQVVTNHGKDRKEEKPEQNPQPCQQCWLPADVAIGKWLETVLDWRHRLRGRLGSFQAQDPHRAMSPRCTRLLSFHQTILRVTAGNWSEKDRIPIQIPPCDSCGVLNTYAGTRTFLRFFYAGELIMECVLASAALPYRLCQKFIKSCRVMSVAPARVQATGYQ